MYVITDGTLGEMTKAIVVTRKEDIEDAILLFMLDTNSTKESVTVNPIGEPLASVKYSPKLPATRKCMACGELTTKAHCPDAFCGAFTQLV